MTFTVRGYKDNELIAEECGVEDIALNWMIEELTEEGFIVEVIQE